MFEIKEISGRKSICLALIYLVWSVVFFNFAIYPRILALSKSMDFPEEKFAFAPVYFYSFLDVIGMQGRSLYFYFQILDYLNGFLLALALFAAIYYFLGKIGWPKLPAVLLLVPPVLFFLAEVVENSLIICLTRSFPAENLRLASWAGLTTGTKIVFGALSHLIFLLVALVYWIRILLRRFKKS